MLKAEIPDTTVLRLRGGGKGYGRGRKVQFCESSNHEIWQQESFGFHMPLSALTFVAVGELPGDFTEGKLDVPEVASRVTERTTCTAG